MTTWGIRGWTPQWLDSTPALLAQHGERLRDVVGRRVTRSWVVWVLDHDERFADLPVVLDIGDIRLELCLQKLQAVSLTWNTIETGAGVAPWRHGGWDLEWRQDADPALASATGHTVESVSLLEHLFATHTLTGRAVDEVWLPGGLALALSGGRVLRLYNNLDEVGISSVASTEGEATRLHPLPAPRAPDERGHAGVTSRDQPGHGRRNGPY